MEEKDKKTVKDDKKKKVVKKAKTTEKKPVKKVTEKKTIKENKTEKKENIEKVVKPVEEVKEEKVEHVHEPVVHHKEEHTHAHVEEKKEEHPVKSEPKKRSRIRVRKDDNSSSMFALYLVLVVLIIFLVIFLLIRGSKPKDKYANIITDDNDLAVNGEIFKSYEEFNTRFGSKELSEDEFEENNFAVLIVSYDSCSQKKLELEKYEKVGDQLRAYFTLEKDCNDCAAKFRYYFLPVAKDVTEELNISVDYQTKNNPKCE
jgi:hypothetical protein